MDCRTFRALHLDLLDDTLPARDRAAALSHRDVCPACARFDCLVRRSALLVRNLPPIVARPGFEAELRARIALDQAGARRGVRPGVRPIGIRAAAAAAAIALLAGGWAAAAHRVPPVLSVPATALAPASVDRLPQFDAGDDGALRGQLGSPAWRAPIWSATAASVAAPVRFAASDAESFGGAR